MNNSNDIQVNGSFQESAASNIQSRTSDSNANVNNQSKGAIPKIKSTTTTRKSAKLNNNVEEVIIQNGSSESLREINGFSKLSSRRSTAYIDDYDRRMYDSSKCENSLNKSNSSQLHHELLDSHQNDETEFNVLPCGISSYQPIPGSSRQADSDFQFKLDLESSESEDNELLSISDDGCIYTYKGDHVADLPKSFFSLDIPPQNNVPLIQNREDDASPEMDFLEMDFDPGPSGDGDSDTQSNIDLENTENLPQDVMINNFNNIALHSSYDHNKLINNACCSSTTTTNTNEVQDPSRSLHSQYALDSLSACCSKGSLTPNTKKESAIQRVLQKLEKQKMPWACTMAQRTTSYSSTPLRLHWHGSNGELNLHSDKLQSLNFHILNTTDYCDKYKRYINNKLKVVLLWTDEEAIKKQITQIGASACGATAVLNVLKVLSFPIAAVEQVQEAVRTRLRANTSPLKEYLLSRSVAGSTHVDLINGLEKLTQGKVYARFFHMFPERIVNLNSWLYFWMSHGAIPIATLNLQKTSAPISDAWHHQMIFGVTAHGVFLTNPLEYVESRYLWPQLCSESVLLIKKEDVLSRWNIKTDLQELIKIKNKKWDELNVVGQVASMVRASKLTNRSSYKSASHIKIPAAYLSGITLVIRRDAPQYPLLVCCPALPVLHSQSTATGCTNDFY